MSVWQFLFPLLHDRKIRYLAMSGLCIFWSMKEALFPYFAKQMIDTLAENSPGELTGFFFPALLLIALWISMECALRASAHIQQSLFPELRARVRQKAFDWVAKKPTHFFETELSGDLGSRLTTLPLSFEKGVEIFSLHIVSIGCAYGIGLALFLSVHWSFFLCAIGWIVGYFALFFWGNRQLHQTQELHAQAVGVLNGKIMDLIGNILSVRLFSRLPNEKEEMAKDQKIEIEASKRAFAQMEKMKRLHGALSVLFLTGMVFLLALGWRQQTVELGDFMMIPMLTFSMLGMIWWLGGEVSTLIQEWGQVRSTLEMLSPPLEQKEEGVTLSVQQGEIAFENISFGYGEGRDHFSNFSLKIGAKERVGIVGPTGAGKSTLTKLLLGLHPLREGKITIDGIDIGTISPASLYDQIAVIPQDPILFHRSIGENILYGRPDVSHESLLHFSELAHCHEFIAELPDQYRTIVGERGLKLSSGQRQRIAIARAFLKQAPILLIDEATSSIDPITEQKIHESLEHLRQNRTTLIIAHRLSTLRQLDRIVVIDRGKIVEEGTFTELTRANGFFSKMVKTDAETQSSQ